MTRWIGFFLAAFLAGLVIGRGGQAAGAALWWLAPPLLLLARRHVFYAGVVAIWIGLCLGSWRGSVTARQLELYAPLIGQELTLTGQAFDDAYYSDRGQGEFYLVGIKVGDQPLVGRVRVRARGAEAVQRGDHVRVTGRLYPGFGNRQGAVSFAELEIVSRPTSWLDRWRRRFFQAVRSVMPEPQASLGLGFLVGFRSDIPEDLQEQLSATGLTHIVAASGYNLTVLVQACRKLLARGSKYRATIGGLALVAVFVIVSGGSPSIVRASLVSGLSLWAGHFGRELPAYLLLLLPAALTAAFNPMYLWTDIGWHLSFLAFFGVLVVAPIVRARFWRQEPKLIGAMMLETTAAQIMTTPYIMYIFGRVSLISLVANAVVLPLVPLAMLGTFVAGVSAMVTPVLGGWPAWPGSQTIAFITNAVAWLGVPEQLLAVRSSRGALLACYAVFTIVLALASRRVRILDKLAKA